MTTDKTKRLVLILLCLTIYADPIFARGGGSEAGGELFLGILGAILGFALGKVVGRWLLPNAEETLQFFAGFLTILVSIVVLGLWWIATAILCGSLYYFVNKK